MVGDKKEFGDVKNVNKGNAGRGVRRCGVLWWEVLIIVEVSI